MVVTTMGTITDTPRSADLSGHSIDNPSPASGSLPNKPRNKFQYTAGVTSTSDTLAPPHDSETRLPPARPGKACTTQGSRSKPETENSAARCRVILGRELKNKQLSKVQSQPESTLVGDNVNFQYSARNPAAGVSSSITRTARSRVRVRQVYRRNVAVRAIDKRGSYVHYLGWKIKQLKSKIVSHTDDLDRDIKLANSKIDSYIHYVKRITDLIHVEIVRYYCDHIRSHKPWRLKLNSYCRDAFKIANQIRSKRDLCALNINRNLELLNSKIGPYTHDVDRQMMTLESKSASFQEDFLRKERLLRSKVDSFRNLFIKYMLVAARQGIRCQDFRRVMDKRWHRR